jgi:hypothetical protein
MHKKSILASIALSLFSSSNHKHDLNKQSEQALPQARIKKASERVYSKERINLDAEFISDNPFDQKKVQYCWLVEDPSTQVVRYFDRKNLNWIPPKAGNYKVVLDITYFKKKASAQVELDVKEREHLLETNNV